MRGPGTGCPQRIGSPAAVSHVKVEGFGNLRHAVQVTKLRAFHQDELIDRRLRNNFAICHSHNQLKERPAANVASFSRSNNITYRVDELSCNLTMRLSRAPPGRKSANQREHVLSESSPALRGQFRRQESIIEVISAGISD